MAMCQGMRFPLVRIESVLFKPLAGRKKARWTGLALNGSSIMGVEVLVAGHDPAKAVQPGTFVFQGIVTRGSVHEGFTYGIRNRLVDDGRYGTDRCWAHH